MQRHPLMINRVLLGAAAISLVAQPAEALTQGIGITLNTTANGIDIVLQLQATAQDNAVDRLLVFTSGQGNTWVANITNAQLNLPANKPYRRANPAPGIAAISMTPRSCVNFLWVRIK